MIKLQHIETLLAIERAGSIRAAAKLLGRTQPAVTKALRQAEAELGAAIFKRSPSGVAVTEDGKPILLRARVIQSELRKMREEVAQRRGLGSGRINVTVSPLAAARIIAPAIKRFRREYPGVHVEITGGHEPIAFGPVRDGVVDLVIGPEPQSSETAGLSVHPLVETPVVVITGETSKWRGATRLGELVEGEWLLIGSLARVPYLQRHFTSHGLTPPTPLITSDSIFSVLTIVQNSDFLCTFPELLLPETMTKWHVRPLKLAETLRPAQISTVTSSERLPTPALRHFCDCVEQVALNAFGRLGYSRN